MTTKEVWAQYSDDLKRFILSKVKDITKLKSWIFSIARNSMMDHFKTSKITFEIAGFESETNIPENVHTEKDCLRGILQGLPKKYRDPLFLSDIKGLKQTEVAKQLKQNLPTTKSQIQRARKLIAQGFMDCCGFVLNEQGHLVGEVQEKEDCKVCG